MPGARNGTRSRAAPASRPNGQVARARTVASDAGDQAAQSAPKLETTKNGTRRGRAERRKSESPEAVLHDLLRGLRAGDLESLLLTVAMAAEENRMPSAEPDEAERILAFLGRLAEYDPALPPSPGGAGTEP